MSKAEIKDVAVTIEQPTSRSPGRVSYGRYAVHGDYVVMYGEDDEPMKDRRGNRYELMIEDGVNPEQLAGILTMRIRRELGGDDNKFNRPFEFPENETFV